MKLSDADRISIAQGMANPHLVQYFKALIQETEEDILHHTPKEFSHEALMDYYSKQRALQAQIAMLKSFLEAAASSPSN